MNTLILAAGPPDKPWVNMPVEVKNIAELMIRWAMWMGIGLSVIAVIIFMAMAALEKQRGESGFAMTNTARILEIALGIGIISAAPQIISWFISSIPS